MNNAQHTEGDCQVYELEICSVCDKQCYVRCKGCRTLYCGPECQKTDSSRHKTQHAKKVEIPMESPEVVVVPLKVEKPMEHPESANRVKLQDRLKRVGSMIESQNFVTPMKSSSALNISKDNLKEEASKATAFKKNLVAPRPLKQTSESAGDQDDDWSQADHKSANKQVQELQKPTEVLETKKDEIKTCSVAPQKSESAASCASAKNPLVDIIEAPPASKSYKHTPEPLIRTYESPAPIPDDLKDSQGYFKVIVHVINEIVYCVLKSEFYNLHSKQLQWNKYYEKEGTPFVNLDLLKEHNTLIMALIFGNWTRCKVLCNGKEITLEDIDRGLKYDLIRGNYPLKHANDREKALHTFAYKMIFENAAEYGPINVVDHLKVRLVDENFAGVSKAEIFVEKKVQRFTIETMKVVHFPLCDQLLMLMDGEQIIEGKMHVALANPENEAFYEELPKKIKNYMKDNGDKNNYKPENREMVLVRYTDGNIHRAICCNNNGDGTQAFVLIDWGNKYTTTPTNVWNISKELAELPVISRTVNFAAKSGKSLDKIDSERTIAKLNDDECFQGFVEMLAKNKYLVTIDDSWIAYKK